MSVVNLTMVRAARDAAASEPDANCVAYDSDGNKMFLFAMDFAHEGKEFTFSVFAYSADDAAARAASIRDTVKMSGQITAMGEL